PMDRRQRILFSPRPSLPQLSLAQPPRPATIASRNASRLLPPRLLLFSSCERRINSQLATANHLCDKITIERNLGHARQRRVTVRLGFFRCFHLENQLRCVLGEFHR